MSKKKTQIQIHLSCLQVDNRGNRLIVTDDSDINTPAVAAAYAIKRYSKQAQDEISFEVCRKVKVVGRIWLMLVMYVKQGVQKYIVRMKSNSAVVWKYISNVSQCWSKSRLGRQRVRLSVVHREIQLG